MVQDKDYASGRGGEIHPGEARGERGWKGGRTRRARLPMPLVFLHSASVERSFKRFCEGERGGGGREGHPTSWSGSA